MGDELAVILPDEIVKLYGWKVGDDVDVSYDKEINAIVVQKIESADV